VQLAAHVPAEQLCPSRQGLAHPPQLSESVLVSTQTPLHNISPAAQDRWQVPEEQVWPDAQAVPQPPQFLGSVEMFVQTAEEPVPQICFGELHTQAAAVHTSPAMQTFSQPPQFAPLVAVSTHLPVVKARGGQIVTVAGVVSHTHAAAWQVPSPQSRPQAPQLAVLVWKSTHSTPHLSGFADGQMHCPAVHVAPT
jgi:hypothetical protein